MCEKKGVWHCPVCWQLTDFWKSLIMKVIPSGTKSPDTNWLTQFPEGLNLIQEHNYQTYQFLGKKSLLLGQHMAASMFKMIRQTIVLIWHHNDAN